MTEQEVPVDVEQPNEIEPEELNESDRDEARRLLVEEPDVAEDVDGLPGDVRDGTIDDSAEG